MLFLIAIATLNLICNGQPMKDDTVPAGNLMYTFGSNDEIPAAFFDGSSQRQERKAMRPCDDGSGGICVEVGQCPKHLKSNSTDPNICPAGSECCFGPAANDLSCGSRGGECRTGKNCGKGPMFMEANDCGTGQVCCILI